MAKGSGIFAVLVAIAFVAAGCSTQRDAGEAVEKKSTPPATSDSSPAAASPSAPQSSTGAVKPYSETLSLQGISFTVSCPNNGSTNPVTIKPQGLTVSNEEIKDEAQGVVTRAEVADLNADGSPEIYVYVSSVGPDKKGSLIAYSANNKKSLSGISLSEIEPGSTEAKGYQGHDEMAVVEGTFVRRFDIYPATGGKVPTGKTRQIQYKLKPGEASWQLVKNKVIEY